LSLPHSGKNFCSAGHEEEAFLGDHLTVGKNRKLAAIAINYLHIQSGFIPQRFRQTGSTFTDRASDRALPNRDLFHRNSPLQANNDQPLLIAARGVPRRINSLPSGVAAGSRPLFGSTSLACRWLQSIGLTEKGRKRSPAEYVRPAPASESPHQPLGSKAPIQLNNPAEVI
jgi:hypothetical protein